MPNRTAHFNILNGVSVCSFRVYSLLGNLRALSYHPLRLHLVAGVRGYSMWGESILYTKPLSGCDGHAASPLVSVDSREVMHCSTPFANYRQTPPFLSLNLLYHLYFSSDLNSHFILTILYSLLYRISYIFSGLTGASFHFTN